MQGPETKDYAVSWEEFHRNSKILSTKLLKIREWKGIVGITRGGIIPACIVARELGIHLVETFCISSYDHMDQRETHILKEPDRAGDGEGWIVIDDLVDTGNTFRVAREILPKAYYACVYAKPAGKDTVDTSIVDIDQDIWLHFPWDLEARYSTPIAERRQEA